MKSLISRAITGILLVIIAFVMCLKGGLYLFVPTIFLLVVALYELHQLFSKHLYNYNYILQVIIGIVYIISIYHQLYVFAELIICTYILLMMIILMNSTTFKLENMLASVFSFALVTKIFGSLLLLNSNKFIWYIFILSWGTDTFAYLSGMLLGKHPLNKKVSPKKTVEGSIGGIVGSTVVAFIFNLFLGSAGSFSIIFISIIGSIIAQIGDLSFSKLKRIAGIKDYGMIFIGHGGVLDRFDSVIFLIPYILFISKLI